jgi:opacity protein-like surface antigen
MNIIPSKTLVFTALATASLISTTKGEPLSSPPQTGFYAGVALGGADLTVKSDLFLNRQMNGAPSPQNFYLTATDKNVAGDIFLGYGKRINYLWIAGEVTGSFASLTSKTTLGISSTTSQFLETKTTNAVGGALKLGYYMSSAHKLYFRAGVELRRFKVKFTDPANFFTSLDKSYNSTAFVPGIGMEVDITSRFSLRAEYRVALHPRKTVQAVGSAVQSTSAQTKPTIHYLNLGLVFKI